MKEGSIVSNGYLNRNYQLDIWKLGFAVIVFLGHALSDFSSIAATPLGYFGAHAFFVISGLLMTNSLMKKDVDKNCAGKEAFYYLLGRYKALALPYVVVLLFDILYFGIINGKEVLTNKLPYLLVELFALSQNGTYIHMISGHTWFLSAMLLGMLPLAYLLIKNKDFYLYVFAPLLSLFCMGYVYQAEGHYLNQYAYCGVVSGGVIRAVWGLTTGSFAWLIFKGITNRVKTSRQRILLTIVEIVASILFLYLLGSPNIDIEGRYASTLLLPIVFAIVFSQKSYVSRLFKSQVFRLAGSLSLALYLNQWGAEVFLMRYFPERGFIWSFVCMAVITTVQCVLYYLVMHLCKKLWKRIKVFFL